MCLAPGEFCRGRCMRVKVGCFAWVLGLVSEVFAQVQVDQVFNLQGPGPSVGVRAIVQSGDLSPTSGSVAGAVQAVVFDPANGNIYVGTPGGGIWVSTNGGTNWTSTSDNKASLAIDSLSLDPTDPSGKTLIAGTGVTSRTRYSKAEVDFRTACCTRRMAVRVGSRSAARLLRART